MIVLGIAYSQVWRGDIIEGREMEIYRIEVWGFEVGRSCGDVEWRRDGGTKERKGGDICGEERLNICGEIEENWNKCNME